jgi:tetratricopeptide (TPR) repeat protein
MHYEMGDFDKALYAVNKVNETDPNHANGWYNKSIYLIKKGKIDEALLCIKKAFELDVDYLKEAKTDKGFKAHKK